MRSAWFGCWGALAGLVGSLCCLGPSAAVLLGLGTSSLLLSLQVERAAALLASLALLGLGGLSALSYARSCPATRPRPGRPLAVMLLAGALSYGLLGGLVPQLAALKPPPSAPALATPPPAVTGVPRRLTLVVEKMICPPCATAINNRLSRLAGVRQLHAEVYDELVTIEYDSQLLDQRALLARLPPNAGVTVLSDQPLVADE